jgi:neural Wiskott-Aldrich syndrome protein
MSQSFAEALSWVPVSAILSGTLGRAHEYARAQGHRTVTLEHLLLALAEDPDASVVLQASNIDIGRLMNDASAHLGHHEDRVAPGQPSDPGADEALVRILDYAAAAARQSRRREINGAIVLAAMVGEARSVAASILQAQGLTFEGAIRALQRTPAPPQRTSLPAPAPGPMQLPPHGAPGGHPASFDPATTVNGAATQTNEQILASVRRRIDASRTAPKPAPAPPGRDFYPAPPVTPPPKQPWEVPRAAVEPTAPPAPVAVPEPPQPPIAEPAPVQPPALEPASAAAGVDRAEAPQPMHADPYLGIYPEPVLQQPGPVAVAPQPYITADDGVRPEAVSRERRPAAETPPTEVPPSRRPPPLPPSTAPVQPAAGPHYGGRQQGPLSEPPPNPLRPRLHGAPVVPPSSIPWPAPVQPQPTALPPVPMAPPPQPPDPNDYDGGIAGAPYPEPDAVSPRPTANVPVPVQRTKVPRMPTSAPSPIEAGQLAENIPRAMRVGRTETVEVRIARASIKAVGDGMQGSGQAHLRALIVTKAMSVRLRAVDGGFAIETGSPETQWLDSNVGPGAEDYASWRWSVTPLRRGEGRLQLVVAARTIASDGLTADTALPDQVFDVTVSADYSRLLRRAAGWVGLMILGGMLSKFGQNGLSTVATLWRGFE